MVYSDCLLCLLYVMSSCESGAHFTNDFSIVIKIRWKIIYVAIYFLAITSLQRFAHAATAQLLCRVKNIMTITLLEFRWEQN